MITQSEASTIPDKLLLRVSEAAYLASVSRTTAYELIAAGIWPRVRIGTAVRVPLAGLRTWVEEQSKGAGSDVNRQTETL